MTRVSVVKAMANFSRLLAEVEAGRDVLITRRRTTVARMSAVSPKSIPLDLPTIAAFRDTLTRSGLTGAKLIRRLREARY